MHTKSGNNSQKADFDDMQALVRFGHGHLKESRFLLLSIKDKHHAGLWLQNSPVSSAARQKVRPKTALQIAFTPAGLAKLGLAKEVLSQFSDEFLVGVSGDENRSRRLGDTDNSAPDRWLWGNHDIDKLHVLLLMYANADTMDEFFDQVTERHFNSAFSILHTLPTDSLQSTEPFGFVDGISQPEIDWQQEQATDLHARDAYSNLLASGEIVLGYGNEYGQLTRRPLIDASRDTHSNTLPVDRRDPGLRDFGINGSYLVLRQLKQDVSTFWKFMNSQGNQEAHKAEELAALMVGRQRDGDPLVSTARQNIPGIRPADRRNHFDFDSDPEGQRCPLGSHIRRSNPRTGDFPPGVDTLWKRLVRLLGFHRKGEYEDLVASSRYHRVLRRGRTYGRDALGEYGDDSREAGLQFICLGSNILRQFEFVQSAWSISSSFAGTREQRDPLTGSRVPRVNGTPTDLFMQADARGAQTKTYVLPEFVTVRGGGYFFMPGLRAIRYLAQVAGEETLPERDIS